MDIPAAAAAKNFGKTLRCARQRPVTITYRGDPDVVMFSVRYWDEVKEAVLEQIRADAEAYADHMAEIARGISLGGVR